MTVAARIAYTHVQPVAPFFPPLHPPPFSPPFLSPSSSPPHLPTSFSLHSHCIAYTGSVCSPFIENIDFFVNDSQRDILDDWAMAAFTEIEQLEGSVTTNPQYSKCVAFAQAVVCHSLYPYCDPSSDSPSARSVCLEACNILTTGVCRDVFDGLASNMTTLIASGCNTVAKEGGDSPECIHVSLESPQKNGEQILVRPFSMIP